MSMEKVKMKKTVSCLLLAIFAAQLFACGDSSSVSDSTDTTTGNPAETTTATATTELSDELGEYNFNGREFNIVTCEAFFFSPYDVEEQTGDLLDDAAYQRNRTIEERFNCDIVYTMLPGSDAQSATAIQQSVLADDDEYQLGIVHPYLGLAGLISNAYVLDWNDIPNINLAKPWWNQTFNEALSIGGILPCAASDFIYFNTGCFYFNKGLAEENQLGNIYDLVYDGAWTWDKVAEISASAYRDINGSGDVDDADQFGYSIINNHRVVPVTYSYGITPSSRDSEGYVVLDNMASEKMSNIVSNYYSMLFENQGALVTKSNELNPFREGRVLFLNYVVQNIKALRDLDWDFGILPMPKYDEEQEEYYSFSQSNVMVVPTTSSDTEFVGTLIEALSAYSYFEVMPALYETTFNNKYLRDEDSIAMFDIIKNSLVYDPLWNYHTSNGTVYFLQSLMSSKSTDIASYYASKHEQNELELRNFFDKTIEAYNN